MGVGGTKEGHVTLYVKNIFDVLQRQVKLCEKRDIMLHLERKQRIPEEISLNMTTTFFNEC